MVEEGGEDVYDIGFGLGNPCRYLQEVFKGFLKCLGLENHGEESKEIPGGDGGGVEAGDDPPPTSPSDDPSDQPVSTTITTRRRAPPKGPISSGGGGQTN